MEGMVDLIEKLCNDVKTVNEFYLRDTLNVSGDCKAAVIANVKISCVIFRK